MFQNSRAFFQFCCIIIYDSFWKPFLFDVLHPASQKSLFLSYSYTIFLLASNYNLLHTPNQACILVFLINSVTGIKIAKIMAKIKAFFNKNTPILSV